MVPVSGDEALGFAIALAAACCYDGGYALQALEARSVPSRHALRPSLLGMLLQRRRWVAGTVLSLAGWPLQVWALSLAPIAIVQPVLALGLLLLLFLGSRLLGEPVGVREVGAVALIIAGVATITVAAPKHTTTVSSTAGVAVALGCLAAVTVLPWMTGVSRRRGAAVLILAAGAGDAMAGFVALLLSDALAKSHWPLAVLYVLLAAGAALLGMTSEMTVLQRRPATRVAPYVLVVQIVVPVILAALVAGEGWGSTAAGGLVLGGGLVLTATGAGVLASAAAVADVIAARAPPQAPSPASASTSVAAEGNRP